MNSVPLETGLSSLLRLSLVMSLMSLQPLGELCVSLHPCPRAHSRLGVECRTCPQGWGGAESWTRGTWPFREWLHPCSPDPDHVSVSELSPCGSECGCGNCPQDSPETLVREADDMRGMWTGWVLRWFREVGPVRPLVAIDCEYTEMLNFKLGFFAPFPEYHLFLINSERSTCCRWRLGELCQVLFLVLTCFL